MTAPWVKAPGAVLQAALDIRKRWRGFLLLRSRKRAALRRLNAFRLESAPRKLEFGSGPHPSPGYVHIDLDAGAVDLDVLAPAHAVPFPDGWAEEVKAVHVLEHVPAEMLMETLATWRRLLQPGGLLDIHVPNGVALARALLKNESVFDSATAWRTNAALFGYTINPDRGDDLAVLRGDPEHRLLFTFPILAELLGRVGFEEVAEPDSHECRHNGPWDEYIPALCLRVTARR